MCAQKPSIGSDARSVALRSTFDKLDDIYLLILRENKIIIFPKIVYRRSVTLCICVGSGSSVDCNSLFSPWRSVRCETMNMNTAHSR